LLDPKRWSRTQDIGPLKLVLRYPAISSKAA
jgi:hypothetical protein